MEKTNINFLKKRLEKELDLLTKELETVGRRNPDNPEDWEAKPAKMDTFPSDTNEEADAFEAYEENSGILNELEIRYNNVKKALKRIEDGTYGICEVSGEKIEADRLEANPAATTCKKHMNKSRG